MKNFIKIILIVIFLITTKPSHSQILDEGEELKYVVYYGFIELGEVVITMINKTDEDGYPVYYAKSNMRTYKSVPFISLNATFESFMRLNNEKLYSMIFKANEQKKDAVTTTKYVFNYDSNYVDIFKEHKSVVEKNEKMNINPNIFFQDGLSMFYEARLNSLKSGSYISPVFMNEQEATVNYYFESRPNNISLGKFRNDISAIRCQGVANFIGVFGLSGEFAGWFSNDQFRVPLKAQFNVIIGSVTMELVSYKKRNWEPPKA